MKTIKKILLTSCATVFLAASIGGIANYSVSVAAESKSGFYVEDGAAVRLKSEHEKFGIKFSAQVGEKVEGATYNILIAPVELIELYEADTNENKADIVTYLKAYAESKGGKLSIVENCEVVDGKIDGAIVNVLWKNINRKFVGVAYYEKDGAITVAQYADDKERSIVDVSQNALDSGDYTAMSDIKVLVEKMRYGEMVENGATADEKYSTAYQYEKFYGASVADNAVTTAAGTSITLSGLTGSVTDNVLQLAFDGENSANGATIDFGTIPAGAYRVSLAHTLVDGTFSSTITQNGTKELATVWETKELGNDVYEFYFKQETEGNASFTIATTSATTGTVTLDNIALEPVKLEDLEYSREKYMFGMGGLASGLNASEGNWCDAGVTSEWMTLAANQLGVESQRVWMSVPHIITRAEDSNELSINQSLANTFHNHFLRLKAAGVKRIMVMLSRFVYPYDYAHCSANCAPDPTDEADVYKTWLEMQYQAFKLIAKEFPEITLWECGNEYDLDTFLYKNGLKDEESWGPLESARDYTFTNTQKAYITADICYLASKAFKLYNPENQIVMPGMSKYAADKSNDHITLSTANKKFYFEEFYKHIESGNLPTLETEKVTDPDKYFDIIAYHAYASSVADFETYNDTLMATAAAHGDGDKRIWITELGFTEENFGGRGTEDAQNAIATLADGMLTSLEQDKYKDLIETVHFFRLSDTEGLIESNVKESCFGIYYSPNAETNANVAKPVAVTLYNYFNNATATAEDITFWKGSTTSEDFENVLFGENMLMNVGPNISLWNVTGELVDYDGGKALQVSYDAATNAYNSITISFGTIEAGNYKVSLTFKVVDGRYSGAILEDDGSSEFSYIPATTALGNDQYCFYFNQAEAGSKKFTISAQQWGMSGTVIIDNISLEEVDEIPTDNTFGVMEEENFDTIEFVNGQTSDIGGVYISPRKLNAETVADGNGGNALKVTRVESGYACIALSVGDIEPGNYKLTLDVLENNGYSAIIQMLQMKNVNGYWKTSTLQDNVNNWGTLFNTAGKNGNTYTLTFSTQTAYEDFAIALAISTSAVGESIIIDNVKFERMVQQSIDFEDGKLLDLAAAKLKGNQGTDTIDAIGFVATTDTLTAGFETVDENTYYKVRYYTGWKCWSAFNLGYLKAGTYTITMDMKVLEGTLNGFFVVNVGGTMTDIASTSYTYTQDGDTYTFKLTLTEDCADFYIGYRANNTDTDFTLAFDNITVTVGTNYDGGASDGYNWIDGIINQENN